MKKIETLLIALLLTLSMQSFGMQSANEAVSEFVGEWKCTVFDTPEGDADMTIIINAEDGALSGKVIGVSGETEIYDVEVTGKELYFMFDKADRNLHVTIELTGEEKIEGYLFDMFIIEGEKVKE